MRDDGKQVEKLMEDSTAAERISFIHDMRLRGKPWREIWKLADTPSEAAAKMQLKHWLQKAALEMEAETRSEHLTMEVNRLDTLQDAAWDDAIDGDKKAMDSVIRIITLRSRLLGLDQGPLTEINATSQTIVVSSAEYIDKLKTIAGETGGNREVGS